MKTFSHPLWKRVLPWWTTIFLGVVASWSLNTKAQDGQASATNAPAVAVTTNSPDADKAWREVRRAQTVMPPPAWTDNKPSPQEVVDFYKTAAVKGANKAKDFYTKFPTHPKAGEARKIEYNLLANAVGQFGDTNEAARLAVLQDAMLKDPALSENERFNLRMGIARGLLERTSPDVSEAVKQARALEKDFPKRPEVYAFLMMVAPSADSDAAREMAQSVIDAPAASDDAKEQAEGLLNRLGAIGKPVDIQFTAVDGREVDMAKLKGKVVLVDFWATWCNPCVHEIPNVKAAYDKLHGQGFEIVGVSLDSDKDALTTFISNHGMAWPQFFDGLQWRNKLARKFGIDSIPAMWLVDKQGNLRDMDGRDSLEDKVAKLLAESPASTANKQ